MEFTFQEKRQISFFSDTTTTGMQDSPSASFQECSPLKTEAQPKFFSQEERMLQTTPEPRFSLEWPETTSALSSDFISTLKHMPRELDNESPLDPYSTNQRPSILSTKETSHSSPRTSSPSFLQDTDSSPLLMNLEPSWTDLTKTKTEKWVIMSLLKKSLPIPQQSFNQFSFNK